MNVAVDGFVVVSGGVGMLLDGVPKAADDFEMVPCELGEESVRAKDDEEAKLGTTTEFEHSARDVLRFGGGPLAKAASVRAARSAPIAALAEVGCPGACMSNQSYS